MSPLPKTLEERVELPDQSKRVVRARGCTYLVVEFIVTGAPPPSTPLEHAKRLEQLRLHGDAPILPDALRRTVASLKHPALQSLAQAKALVLRRRVNDLRV